MSWVVLAILAAFFYALESTLDKVAVSRQLKNPAEATIIGGAALFLSLIVIGAIGGGLTMAPLSVALICFASGIIGHGVNWLYFIALRKEEVSRVMPVYALMPVITTIFAFFVLGEKFSVQTYVGIALVVCGAILISLKPHANGFRLSSALVFVLLSATLAACKAIITKFVDGATNDWTIIMLAGFGGLTAVIVTELAHRHKKIQRREYAGVGILMTSGILGGIATTSFMLAILNGPASLASAHIEVSPVFVLIIASVFATQFPELSDEVVTKRVVLQKILAIVVIAAGAFLISVTA